MKAVLGILALVGAYLLWQWLTHLWDEWSGALGRWCRGEPLRASELQARRWKAERERREQRKAEMRRQHDRDPHLILVTRFAGSSKIWA